jgi:LysR family transcriptional activator of mexEF-oprN operon
MPQVAFAPDAIEMGREDIALRRIRRARNIVITVPDFSTLARVVSRTDLIGSLPPFLARSLAPSLRLTLHPLPIKLDRIPLGLYWHRRMSADPAHRWFRQLLVDLIAKRRVGE